MTTNKNSKKWLIGGAVIAGALVLFSSFKNKTTTGGTTTDEFTKFDTVKTGEAIRATTAEKNGNTVPVIAKTRFSILGMYPKTRMYATNLGKIKIADARVIIANDGGGPGSGNNTNTSS